MYPIHSVTLRVHNYHLTETMLTTESEVYTLTICSFIREHQRAHLDRLARRELLRAARVQKCRVRSETRTVHLRVVALDERDLVRSLAGEVVPLVLGVVAHAVRAPRAVRVDEVHRDEVLLAQVAPVRHRERLVRNRVVDRPPDVDDTHPTLEEAFRILREVVLDALDARVVSLVDVNAFLERR